MSAHEAMIHEELEACRENGLLKPETVVERARNEDSPLHDKFTWDDSDAAHQYRLIEARNLIRVHVIHAAADNSAPIRPYISLTTDRTKDGGGYRAMVDVMSDEALKRQMFKDALQQLRNVQEKYQRLRQLEKVWTAIDEVVDADAMQHAA